MFITGRVVEFTRRELVDIMFKDPVKNWDRKGQNLQEMIISKTNCPPDNQNATRYKVSLFLNKIKSKYLDAGRRKDLFYKRHSAWLNEKEMFPNYAALPGPGRPSSSFDVVGERSKRRKVAHLGETASGNELSFAAAMTYRKEGQSDKAKAISKISSASSVKLKSYMSSFSSDNNCLTPEEALCVLLDAQLSVYQYNVIRQAATSRFPSYKKVLEVKKLCYPNENAISASEKHVQVALQDLLDHTCTRLALVCKEVFLSLENDTITDLKLHIKWGIDGTSGFTEYKQKFQDASGSDAAMLVTCMVPIRLVGNTSIQKDVIFWQNNRPSSPRFCRPIQLQFEHETTERTKQEMMRVEGEIHNLRPTNIEVGTKHFAISHELYFTMTDGKICNAVTDTSSTQRCYICKKTSSQFNSIAASRQAPVDNESLRFGLSILHGWIRMFECLLHVSYKLPVSKWRVTKPQDKLVVEETKKRIQQEFKTKLGLIIDRPKPGYGNSNDGNTARRFFDNIEISAAITGVNKNLIHRFHIVLMTLSSGFDIDTKKFDIYCLKTAVLFVKLYPWFNMPTSVHKILMHSSIVISHALLPIGLLTEEAQEARNKDIKRYREQYSRKCSREMTIRDVFNRLLVTSDPFISSMRKLPIKKIKVLPCEVTEMLLPFNVQRMDTKSSSTEGDSDSASEFSD